MQAVAAAAARPNPVGLSPVVAGAWRLAEWQWTAQQRLAWIEANLDIGVSSFDHADIGGSAPIEALFGEALALRPALRQRLQLVGQCGIAADATAAAVSQPTPSLAARLRSAVQQSLRRLQTDRLDLLLVHGAVAPDNIDTLADALVALRREGLVQHIGVSNCSPQQLAPLHQRLALATHQIELSPLHGDALCNGQLAQCLALGLRPMAWAPLAGGRIFTSNSAAAQRLRQTLQSLSEALGVSIITLLIAWVVGHASRPFPILGSRRIAVAQQAMAALALPLDAPLWQQTWQQIWHVARGDAPAQDLQG